MADIAQGVETLPLYVKPITPTILRRILYQRGAGTWDVRGSEGESNRERRRELGAFRPPSGVFKCSPEIERLYFFLWIGVIPEGTLGAGSLLYREQAFKQKCALCGWEGACFADHLVAGCPDIAETRAKFFGAERLEECEAWPLYQKPRQVLEFLREADTEARRRRSAGILTNRMTKLLKEHGDRIGISMVKDKKEKEKRANLIEQERLQSYF